MDAFSPPSAFRLPPSAFGFRSVAEGDLNVARGLQQFTVGRDESQAVDGLSNWHVVHLVILIAHHRAELLFVD